MRVDIARIVALREELDAFNRLDLGEIEFYDGGVRLDIRAAVIEEWGFTGLNNVDFVILTPWDKREGKADPTDKMGSREEAVDDPIQAFQRGIAVR